MMIKLNKEQTIKFLMCFVDDARRIANERKQDQLKQDQSTQKIS